MYGHGHEHTTFDLGGDTTTGELCEFMLEADCRRASVSGFISAKLVVLWDDERE